MIGRNQINAKNRVLELRIFGGSGSLVAFKGPAGGQKKGSVAAWHTGHFAIHHSMNTSLQEIFPINKLIIDNDLFQN